MSRKPPSEFEVARLMKRAREPINRSEWSAAMLFGNIAACLRDLRRILISAGINADETISTMDDCFDEIAQRFIGYAPSRNDNDGE